MLPFDCIERAISVYLLGSPHANPQLNDRPNEICFRRSAPRYERANGENNAAVKSRGRNHVWEEWQITRKYIQRKGEIIVMDIALAIVDFWQNLSICLSAEYHLPTRNPWTKKQPDWSCGLTARKAGNYQRSSKRKRRRTVPADRVYYIQSAYPFQ